MKYIDAELLRSEIKKRLKNVRDYMTGVGMKYKRQKSDIERTARHFYELGLNARKEK